MQDLFDLSGKTALVTGGNGGIGLGIAQGLVNAGASVAIAGRNAEKNAAALESLQALGGKVTAIIADVTVPADIERMVKTTAEELGGVDILIANAGMNFRKRPEEYSLTEWHTIMDTNLTGIFVCCQAVYPFMQQRGGGKIVTIGSLTSLFGLDVAAVYAASKGAVVQLTSSLAMAWAKDNIQVNAILPGWIDTDLTRRARTISSVLHDNVVKGTPAGRWGKPEDLAGTAIFYASAASNFVTGTALLVDGGFATSMF